MPQAKKSKVVRKLRAVFGDGSRIRTLIFVGLFAVAGITLLVAIRAASNFASVEPESASLQGVTAANDATASGGRYLQFGAGAVTPPPTGTGPQLPAPINPAGRDFGTILKSYPNGGTIVLPDGDYKVSDVSGFNPSAFLVVVAQNPGKARVVRTSNTLGATDQLFSGSSKMIFVGLNFYQIDTIMNNSNNIHFWYTKHSFPIESHPTPNQTVCGGGQGPVTFEMTGSNNIKMFGIDAIGIGHDGIKLNATSNVTIKGSVVDQLDHKNLQQGRGNASCGWDGNDNYHIDAVQTYPGGVNNLNIENSFFGQRMTLQVDTNGASNKGMVLRNNSSYEGTARAGVSCLGIDARVKTGAQAGATQDMIVTGSEVYCHNTTEWTFYVAGSRDNALSINGTPVRSTDKEANEYLSRVVGVPVVANTKIKAWRDANPYNKWNCFFAQNVPGFVNSYGTCN